MHRFEVDQMGEAQAARLRLVAATIAITTSLWLLAVTDAWAPRGAAVLGLIFGTVWIVVIHKRRRSDRLGPDCVEVGTHHLAVRQRGEARSVPLSSVRSVELDHDRLAVVISLEAPGDRITLESAYRGIGLQELAEEIHTAVRVAREDALRENTATMADHE